MMVSMRRVQQSVPSRFQGRTAVRDRTVTRSTRVLRMIVLTACCRHFMVPVMSVIVMVMMMMMPP